MLTATQAGTVARINRRWGSRLALQEAASGNSGPFLKVGLLGQSNSRLARVSGRFPAGCAGDYSAPGFPQSAHPVLAHDQSPPLGSYFSFWLPYEPSVFLTIFPLLQRKPTVRQDLRFSAAIWMIGQQKNVPCRGTIRPSDPRAGPVGRAPAPAGSDSSSSSSCAFGNTVLTPGSLPAPRSHSPWRYASGACH